MLSSRLQRFTATIHADAMLREIKSRVVGALDNVWKEVTRDNLPKRILKCVIATTLTVIVILLPNIKNVYGKAGYLACLTSVFVFGHPGRRLGSMVEALVLATIGCTIGVAWASLGTYLGSLAYKHSPHAEMAIRAIFIMVAAFVHGYIRISTPRLFLLVLLLIMPTLIGLTSPSLSLTKMFPIQFFYPILTAVAILFLVSIMIFPEYGSTYLGQTTIEALQKIQETQRGASDLFVAYASRKNADQCLERLKELTSSKSALRSKVTQCKAALTECSFELAFSVLAPRELKPIAGKGVKNLVGKTVSLIGACESKYALLGLEDPTPNQSTRTSIDVAAFKPRREAEFGDERLLRYLLKRVEEPLRRLQTCVDRSMDIVTTCVAAAYDVPKLPSLKQDQGTGKPRRPKGVLLQEIDIHIDTLTNAIDEFSRRSSDALESAAVLAELSDKDIDDDVDVMPREEVFLVSSFLLNLQQGASETCSILKHSRVLLEHREERKGKRTFYFPRIKLRKWLFSGNEEPENLPPNTREAFQRQMNEDEDYDSASASEKDSVYREWRSRNKKRRKRKKTKKRPLMQRIRRKLANILDKIAESDNLLYAFKFTLGVLLVCWPSFILEWVTWFSLYRGVWASLIFVLVFESAVGSTIWIYFLRTVGTVLGSLWGYAAYSARDGDEYVIAVMIMLGSIPCFYTQLGTKYQKAGMVGTISMCVVALSTHLQTVAGTARDNFTKRVVTMLIGGSVATLVSLCLFPVKARERLKDSLASAIVQINKMESCVALGVDETRNINTSPSLYKRFGKASKKASAALSSAETFLGFTKQEPRLKGDFDGQAAVYKEIIFVLRQVVERMENMLQLRMNYGSAVLEQYNSRVYDYRRNVAASVTLTLFAVHEALTTKLPLPQFLPSARLAHTRMIVRVRQILTEEQDFAIAQTVTMPDPQTLHKRRALRLKLMSWNASSAALEEMVEYLEELVDLTKMLVGVNEFRSGMLHRPNYMDYVKKMQNLRMGLPEDDNAEGSASAREKKSDKRSMGWGSKKEEKKDDDLATIPDTLVRIQSRVLERRRTGQRGRMDS